MSFTRVNPAISRCFDTKTMIGSNTTMILCLQQAIQQSGRSHRSILRTMHVSWRLVFLTTHEKVGKVLVYVAIRRNDGLFRIRLTKAHN